MKDLPTVSRILPAIPIRNNLRSKGCTDLQYQRTPTRRTRKLVKLDVPKEAVLALKPYLGLVINLVKKD